MVPSPGLSATELSLEIEKTAKNKGCGFKINTVVEDPEKVIVYNTENISIYILIDIVNHIVSEGFAKSPVYIKYCEEESRPNPNSFGGGIVIVSKEKGSQHINLDDIIKNDIETPPIISFVHKAQPVGDIKIPCGLIIIKDEFPSHLQSDTSIIHQKNAEAIKDTLLKTMPQGTYDKMAVSIMKKLTDENSFIIPRN